MAKKKPRPTLEQMKETASSCQTKSEFQEKYPFHYRIAREKGVLVEITSHMIDKREKWTPERIRREAEKYQTISEFRGRSSRAYQAARYHNMLDEISEKLKHGKRTPLDSVYLIHLKGTNIYKPGITSSTRGLTRVNDLAMKYGYDVELLIQYKVGRIAPNVEKQLLRIGKFEIDIPEKIRHHSELRSWTKDQLKEAMSIILN